MSELKTIEQVSAWTGIPVRTLYDYRLKSKGPRSFKLGRRVMYAVEDVEAWIEQARETASVGGAA